jgi:Flp pilus assembly protein CpaB
MKLNFSLLLSNLTNQIINWRKELAWAFLVSAVLISVNPLFSKINTETVLVAKNDLTAGSQINSEDFTRIDIPKKFKAANAISASEVNGLILISNLSKGEQLTYSRIISPSTSEQDLVPIRLADSQVAKVIQPGQVVDVISSSDSNSVATVVASQVVIVALFPETQSFTNSQGLLVLVAANSQEAINLAGSGNLKLSLVIRNQ